MAKQQLIKEAFKLQQIAGIKPLYEFESRLVREGLGSSTHKGKKINWNDYEVEEKGIDGGATDSVTLTGIDDEGNKYDAMGEMVHGELDPDTITDIQLLGGIQEGMDSADELLDILLGHVKDPDQAEKYASMDPEMWPEWLEASLNRDPKYTEFAMDKIQEADDDDDAEDMEDDWNKADSDDGYEQEPTKKDIQVGDKMVGVLGGSQSRLQTLMNQKDAILAKFKSGEISIDQYKQEIGNIPQQIKNLQATIEKQMSGGEEGEEGLYEKKESVLGKYIRQEVVRTLKENESVEGKQKHNYPKDRFKDDEEYEKFLDDTLKKLMDKITNDPKLLNVFKRLKDK